MGRRAGPRRPAVGGSAGHARRRAAAGRRGWRQSVLYRRTCCATIRASPSLPDLLHADCGLDGAHLTMNLNTSSSLACRFQKTPHH
jgi:hypothetical protein